MEYQSLLIKYAEIGVKGKNRYLFEDRLVKRSAEVLRKIPGRFQVYKSNGRIYADAAEPFDIDRAADALQHVFGIAGICPVRQLPVMPPEELRRAGIPATVRRELGAEIDGACGQLRLRHLEK